MALTIFQAVEHKIMEGPEGFEKIGLLGDFESGGKKRHPVEVHVRPGDLPLAAEEAAQGITDQKNRDILLRTR